VAPEYLMKEIKKVHQFLVFSVNSLCQVAISEYLDVVSVDGIGYVSREEITSELLETSHTPAL
jgi:methionine aminotransferase